MASGFQPKDSRGFFMLPQAPEQCGYYVYGTPGQGDGQYAHPALLSALSWVEREWHAIDARKFGVGNISLAGGQRYPFHGSHTSGLQVDVRMLRKDGRCLPVTRFEQQYDREATARLIALFQRHPAVSTVLFNDVRVPGVRFWLGHDDHFHVNVRGAHVA